MAVQGAYLFAGVRIPQLHRAVSGRREALALGTKGQAPKLALCHEREDRLATRKAPKYDPAVHRLVRMPAAYFLPARGGEIPAVRAERHQEGGGEGAEFPPGRGIPELDGLPTAGQELAVRAVRHTVDQPHARCAQRTK